MTDGDTITVVVPVFNNAETLPTLLERLEDVASQVERYELEVLFVDDGSSDASFAVLEEAARRDTHVGVLRLSRNFGSNAAILAGLTHARGSAVAVIAADLQDPPELIPELVSQWENGAEVVVATRGSRDDPWFSRFTSAIFNRLFRRLVFPDFPPGGFDFVLLSRRVTSVLVQMGERNSYIFGQAMWVGFPRATVTYDRAARPGGRSGWTLRKKLKYFVDAFTAFSYVPIRAASLLGFLLALVGFAYAALVIVLRLTGTLADTPGFTTLAVLILVIGGIQLIVVGMIGEYVWRVLEETRHRPSFLVRSALNVEIEPRVFTPVDATRE